MRKYIIKLITGEILEIFADGYNVFHHGSLLSFYSVVENGRHLVEYEVVKENVLYIRRMIT